MNEEMTPVLKSWQFFLSCRRILGEPFMTTLFSRGSRQIYRWSADPDVTNDSERNPLDRMTTILQRLHERGRTDVAIAALTIMVNAIGYEISPIDSAIPDKATLEEEMLDDYPALTMFHAKIRENAPIECIRHYAHLAKRGIDETVTKFTERKRLPIPLLRRAK
jgi:uncharacterized membrane protein YkvA (DUF1232 family)